MLNVLKEIEPMIESKMDEIESRVRSYFDIENYATW